MSPEQDLAVNTNDTDPSIDSDKLIDKTGQIAAPEISVGETTVGSEANQGGSYIEQGEFVEGLPVIGAEAENKMHDALTYSEEGPMTGTTFNGGMELKPAFDEAKRDMGGDKEKAIDAMADKAGTEAMAKRVSERAVKFAKEKYPLASDEKVDMFANTIAEKFKSTMEAKQAEEKDKQEQELQDLTDKIESGTPPSEIDSSLDPEHIKPEVSLGTLDSTT